MAELIKNEGKVSARTAYIAMKQGDEAGKLVTNLYVKYLAVGITNVINIFQPDILCIGGGVCQRGRHAARSAEKGGRRAGLFQEKR